MKKMCLILLIIFLISPFILAIRINEVELNPEGKDAGNEWLELYSEDEIDLKNYKIVNNDGDEFVFNKSLNFSEYYIYVFDKQWLDNTDEKIFLYKGDRIIDETNLFYDEKNDGLTLQLCDSWKFVESTEGEENSCEIIAEDTEENDEEPDKPEDNIPEQIIQNKDQIPVNPKPKNIEPDVIKLTPQSIKTNNAEELNNKNSDKNKIAIYEFIGFCVLLGFLFMLKNKKKIYENEFRKK